MSEKYSVKEYIRYLIPSMLAGALISCYAFADTFVVGRKIGADALAAMGICTPALMLDFALGHLFGMGGATLYSIEMGRNNPEKAKSLFSTALGMALVAGLLIALAGCLWTEPIAFMLGADAQTLPFCIPYLRCVMLYSPGIILDSLFSSFIKNDGWPERAMLATMIGTGMNAVVDVIFVFGFGWGMMGAGAATCVCSALALAINLGSAYSRRMNVVPTLRYFSLRYFYPIVRNGFSSLMRSLTLAFVTYIFIMQTTRFYGARGAAAYTVVMNWAMIGGIASMSIAQAAQPLISRNYGAGNIEAVRSYRFYMLCTSVGWGVLYGCLSLTFARPMVEVFARPDTALIDFTVPCFLMYIPALVIMGLPLAISSFFQAVAHAGPALAITTLRGVVLPIAFALALPFFFGPGALWLSVSAAEGVCFLASVVMLRFYSARERE